MSNQEFSTFVMSETTLNQIKALPPETQLKFFWAVANYGVDGIEPDFSGIEFAVWIPMRDLILHSKRKNEKWLQKQQENGKKGGRPKAQNNPDKPTETQNNPDGAWVNSESHNVNGNGNNNGNDNIVGSDEPDFLSSHDDVPEPLQSLKDAIELSTLLLESHRKEIPDYLSGKDDKKIIDSWAKDIELLIRIDKKAPETIRQVISWVKTLGNFWFSNIQSGKKLREKYEALYSQMKSRGNQKVRESPSFSHQQQKKSL